MALVEREKQLRHELRLRALMQDAAKLGGEVERELVPAGRRGGAVAAHEVYAYSGATRAVVEPPTAQPPTDEEEVSLQALLAEVEALRVQSAGDGRSDGQSLGDATPVGARTQPPNSYQTATKQLPNSHQNPKPPNMEPRDSEDAQAALPSHETRPQSAGGSGVAGADAARGDAVASAAAAALRPAADARAVAAVEADAVPAPVPVASLAVDAAASTGPSREAGSGSSPAASKTSCSSSSSEDLGVVELNLPADGAPPAQPARHLAGSAETHDASSSDGDDLAAIAAGVQ